MSSTNELRSLNLNHLPVLREVLRLKGVSRAAETLHLSQPAVSNILKNLRGHFGDELIIRDSGKMTRTAKGDELLSLLEASLSGVEAALRNRSFEITEAKGPLRVALVDNLISLAAEALCQRLDQQAPKLSLHLLQATINLAADLRDGSIDIAVTSTEFINSPQVSETQREAINVMPLICEPLVCIARASDTEFSKGLSVDDYLDRNHASYAVHPDHPYTIERKRLRESGIRRATRILTATNESLPHIVASSDCIAIVPISMAVKAASYLPIQYRRPPIELPCIEWAIIWHDRLAEDPLVDWAKDVILSCATDLKLQFYAKVGAAEG